MNRTLSYGAKVFAHLDPSKGVDAYRQQDGGHGSRNPLRSVEQEEEHALENVGQTLVGSLMRRTAHTHRHRHTVVSCVSTLASRHSKTTPLRGRAGQYTAYEAGPGMASAALGNA